MVESLMLIDGNAATIKERVAHLSLANAKQLAIGRLGSQCVVLHVAATAAADLQRAAADFAGVSGVTGVTIVAIRSV